jgi:hypothetical protein
VAEALRLFEDLPGLGFAPSIETYNVVITALCAYPVCACVD